MDIKVIGNIPQYAQQGDAGADLIATEEVLLRAGARAIVPTGTWLEIPAGYVGLIHPRSGLAAKQGITVLNAPGTIDSGFRGEIKVILSNQSASTVVIEKNQRIAQLVIQEFVTANFVASNNLEDSLRGEAGFGSTGK